jgi:hypothetical protein
MNETTKPNKCIGKGKQRWVPGGYNEEGEHVAGKYVTGDGINCKFKPVTETQDVCTHCGEVVNY